MKRTLIVIIAIMLVLMLTFGLFACNNKNNPTDNNGGNTDNGNTDNGNTDNNGGNGNGAGTVSYNANVGDQTYVQPAAGNLTTEQVVGEVAPFVNKIAHTFEEDSDFDAASDPEIVGLLTLIFNKAGVDQTFLAKYIAVADAVWDSAAKGVIADLEGDEDLSTAIGKVMTAENIRMGLTTLGELVRELDANQVVAVTCAVLDVVSADFYGDNNYDEAQVNAKLAALDVDADALRSANIMAIERALVTDEAIYLLNTGIYMMQNLATFSAEELAATATVVAKMASVADQDGFEALLDSSEVSFKDMVSVVNTAGRVVNTMFAAVGNQQQFGLALSTFAQRYMFDSFELSAEGKAKVQGLLAHPELVGTVANVMANLTVNDVTTIYTNYDDWSKKQGTAAGDKAFVVLVGSVINVIKPQYQALNADAKAAVAAFLGDATLVADADAIIAALPADLDAITDDQVTDLMAKFDAIKKKVDIDVMDKASKADKPYELHSNDSVPYVVASADISKEDLTNLLKKLNYDWYLQSMPEGSDEDWPSFVELDEKDFDLSFVTEGGVTYAVLSGEQVAGKVALRAGTDGLVVTPRYNSSSVLRIAKGASNEEIATVVRSSVSSDMAWYDSSKGLAYDFEYNYEKSDVSVSGLGTETGKRAVLINISTPYGVFRTVRNAVVYDPENLQIEKVESYSTPIVAKGATEADFNEKISLRVIKDNGTSTYVNEGWTVSGFDTSARGDFKATLTYQGHTTTISYHVYDPENLIETRIDCDYYSNLSVGDTQDALALKVSVIYDDGSSKPLAPEAYTTSGFDTSEAGDLRVKVQYGKFTRTIYPTVYDYSQAEINSIGAYTQTGSINVGDDVSALGIRVSVYYRYDTQYYPSRTIDEGFEVEGFDSETSGWKTATVTYAGKTSTIWYEVQEVEE